MKPDNAPRGAVETPSAAPRAVLPDRVAPPTLALAPAARAQLAFARFARSRVGRTAIFLGALGIAFMLARWAGQDDEKTEDGDVPESPLLQVEKLNSLIVRQDGEKYWEIVAARVALSPDGSSTVVKDVSKGTLYRGGKPFLTMRSPTVRLSNRTNNLLASGGVLVKGPDGFAFSTPQTLWIQRLQTIECDKPVKATLRNLTFSAPELSYNWKSGMLSCAHPVEVQTVGAKMSAGAMELNVHTRVLSLKGGTQFCFDPKVARPDSLKGLESIPGMESAPSPTPQPKG